MGKLIRNGIEYGGGNGTDIFEVTQAEYDALVQAGTLVHNALYVITDAPNLNATAQDISYDGGADTVWDKVESKADTTSTVQKVYADLNWSSTHSFTIANNCVLIATTDSSDSTTKIRIYSDNTVNKWAISSTDLISNISYTSGTLTITLSSNRGLIVYKL